MRNASCYQTSIIASAPAGSRPSPEAVEGGPIAKLRDGDRVRVGSEAGVLDALVDEAEWSARPLATADLSAHEHGLGRELFRAFRHAVGTAESGAAVAV